MKQRTFSRPWIVRFGRDDCGAVLVEFAFVLPVLLLLLFGIIGWGISLSMNNAMYDTARSCARSLAIGSIGESDVSGAAECSVAGWGSDFDVAGTIVGTNAVVQVSTANPLAMVVPFVPMPQTLAAAVTMPVEAPAGTGGSGTSGGGTSGGSSGGCVYNCYND